MISKNRIKYYSSLKQKKIRDLEKRFLVEGVRLCEEALLSNYQVDVLLCCPSRIASERAYQVIDRAEELNIPVEEIDEPAVKQISDTVHSQGLLAVAQKRSCTFENIVDARAPVVAFDQIRDPGNLGVILRTASWFGMTGVLLSEHSVDFTNPKVVRASMGGVFHLNLLPGVKLKAALEELREAGYGLFIAQVRGGTPYPEVEFSRSSVMILGSEAAGVRAELRSLAATGITIPRIGKGESLNLSVAAGILFAEIARSRA